MQTLSVNEFRANLKKAADLVVSHHEPIVITRRNGGNLVIFSEEDWNAEQETLYVLQNKALMKQIANSLLQTASHKKLSQEELHAEFDL